MYDNQTKQQTATIYYNAPRSVNIGDVFYGISPVDFQAFHEPCRVCEGEKKLTVNGVTFKCPCCGSEDETIKICGYVVRRYRVYAIMDEVSADEWKASHYHDVTFKIYRKTGKGRQSTWQGYERREIHARAFNNLNKPFTNEGRFQAYDDALYDDYKLACAVAAELTAKEVRRLTDYNHLRGTAHEAVFKETNDPKSN